MKRIILKKGLSLISIMLIVVIFVILLTALVIYNINTPQMKFNIAMGSLIREINNIESNTEIRKIISSANKNAFEINSQISMQFNPVNTEVEELNNIKDILNNSKLNINMVIDQKNDYAHSNLVYNYNNEKAMDVSVYSNYGKNYLYLKDIFEKYIVIDNIEGNSDYTSTNIFLKQDYSYIQKVISKSFARFYKKKYVISENEVLNDYNKQINTTKTSLLIGQMVNDGLLEYILRDIMKDSKCVNILINMINNPDYATKDEINTYLIEMIDNVRKNTKIDEKISVYTSGAFNKILKYELYFSETDKIEYSKVKSDEYDSNISYEQSNNKIIEIKMKNTKKDNYNIDVVFGISGSKLNINGIISDKNTDIKYTYYLPQDSALVYDSGKIEGTYKHNYEVLEKDKRYKDNLEFGISNKYIGSFTLNISSELGLLGKSTETPSFSYIVNASELDEYDTDKIIDNIYKKYPNLVSLLNTFYSLTGTKII
ncbi:MAG: hypothetical protein N2749_04545 [Clostridia bacterium]|nr:hypothetical protein [Clostridia bacterium]